MGSVPLTSQALLMDNIVALAGNKARTDDYPDIMEEYYQRQTCVSLVFQRYGLISSSRNCFH